MNQYLWKKNMSREKETLQSGMDIFYLNKETKKMWEYLSGCSLLLCYSFFNLKQIINIIVKLLL